MESEAHMLAEPWRRERAAPRWIGQPMTSCTSSKVAWRQCQPSNVPRIRAVVRRNLHSRCIRNALGERRADPGATACGCGQAAAPAVTQPLARMLPALLTGPQHSEASLLQCLRTWQGPSAQACGTRLACTGVVSANLSRCPSSTPPTRVLVMTFSPGTYGTTCAGGRCKIGFCR